MIYDSLRALHASAAEQFKEHANFSIAVAEAFRRFPDYIKALPPGSFLRTSFHGPQIPFGLGTHAHPVARPGYLDETYRGFFQELMLQAHCALFEHILFDALRLLLVDRPTRLPKDKQLTYSAIIAAHDREDLIEQMADRELNELKYKAPREWLDYAGKLVTRAQLPTDTADQIAEIKATRDLLAHTRGIVNETYLKKAGARARGTLGDRVVVDAAYTHQAWFTLALGCEHILDALVEAHKEQ